MPIRPELRKFYGATWRKRRIVLIAALGNRCVRCGLAHPRINVAHTTHNPRSGLVALMCPSCHATMDSHQRWAMTRRSRAKRVGQWWLLPEIEWAPYAAWMRPRAVVKADQGELF
jgi:hypothetical protein